MSTVPASLDALVDIFGAAVPEARVDDGPTTLEPERGTDQIAVEIVVGWRPSGAAVENTVEREGGAGDDRELYRVWCAIIVSFGETTTKPLRNKIYGVFGLLEQALRAHHPLSPGVLRARMELGDYEPRLIEDGAEAMLQFAVEVDAFVR